MDIELEQVFTAKQGMKETILLMRILTGIEAKEDKLLMMQAKVKVKEEIWDQEDQLCKINHNLNHNLKTWIWDEEDE